MCTGAVFALKLFFSVGMFSRPYYAETAVIHWKEAMYSLQTISTAFIAASGEGRWVLGMRLSNCRTFQTLGTALSGLRGGARGIGNVIIKL